ncbi:MAG: GNAT family N-acetyltransferase [Aggregatilineales bacterium]
MLVIDSELELVLIQAHHAEPLFKIVERDRAYLRRWQNWPDYIQTVDDMMMIVDRSDQKISTGNGFDLVICYRGQVVGKIGLVYVAVAHLRTEIGYWLGQDFQGHGIMTRACVAVTAYAFHHMLMETVNIRCALGNTRSRAIPERLGFVDTGLLPNKTWLHGRRIEETLYMMTPDRWSRLHNPQHKI